MPIKRVQTLMCWNTRSNWWRISVNFSPKSSQIHHALRTVAGCFAVKSTDYFWHDSCNASKRFHIWESIMLELLFVIGFFVMLMVTGVSLLGIIAALIVATAFMFLGGMLALMIKLLPWLLLAVAVVWVIRAIKAPKVPKYQRYDRWRY